MKLSIKVTWSRLKDMPSAQGKYGEGWGKKLWTSGTDNKEIESQEETKTLELKGPITEMKRSVDRLKSTVRPTRNEHRDPEVEQLKLSDLKRKCYQRNLSMV